jgi:hypothetical protein
MLQHVVPATRRESIGWISCVILDTHSWFTNHKLDDTIFIRAVQIQLTSFLRAARGSISSMKGLEASVPKTSDLARTHGARAHVGPPTWQGSSNFGKMAK